MRSLALLCLAGAAACSDAGLALTIGAADVPAGADRIEIVLASPDAIDTIEGQPAGGSARYYRQKSTGGELDKIGKLDGFTVRIEAGGAGSEEFIPFVIAYAGDSPVAAGAVLDAQGAPMPLAVPASSRIEASVALVPLAAADPVIGVKAGQIEEVRCDGARSGIAWQLPSGPQIRLLQPDPGGDGKLDASARPLDLDCDGYRAGAGDCDDLRARVSPGAAEACDGVDSNCDGAHYAVEQCTPPDGECAPGSADGIRTCREVAGGASTTCTGSPACRCRSGGPGPCARCVLAIEGTASPVEPCAPAFARLPLVTCTQLSPCLVEVLQYPDSAGWEIDIASGAQLDWKLYATVLNGELALRVKPRKSSVAAAPGASVGAVHLVIAANANSFTAIGIDLELGPGRLEGCATIPTMDGLYPMVCGLQ